VKKKEGVENSWATPPQRRRYKPGEGKEGRKKDFPIRPPLKEGEGGKGRKRGEGPGLKYGREKVTELSTRRSSERGEKKRTARSLRKGG